MAVPDEAGRAQGRRVLVGLRRGALRGVARHRLVSGLRHVATIFGTNREAHAIADACDLVYWLANGDPRQSRAETLKNITSRAKKIAKSLSVLR